MNKKELQQSEIILNKKLQGEYFQLEVLAPSIVKNTQPGQFVHIRILSLDNYLLRRPFSIFNVDCNTGTLSIVYKRVGKGTQCLCELPVGTKISVMGALGNGFVIPKQKNIYPIIVAGGYGSAATYLLAKNFSSKPGTFLIGGRSEMDIILLDYFEKTGFTVGVSTNDGSLGYKGYVTDILKQALLKHSDLKSMIFACGPKPMLQAVAKIAIENSVDAQVSLDEHMCCGVGACFACVTKIKADNETGWVYSRSCTDGPVYDASEVFWE